VLSLVVSTADQYTALTGIVSALADGCLSKALEYASMVNTEGRRDALAADIVDALVYRSLQEIIPVQLVEVLAIIKRVDIADSAISAVIERFDELPDIPLSTVDELAPLFGRLSAISESVLACRSLVRGSISLISMVKDARMG